MSMIKDRWRGRDQLIRAVVAIRDGKIAMRGTIFMPEADGKYLFRQRRMSFDDLQLALDKYRPIDKPNIIFQFD
jgi:hypothetical protein